MMSVSTLLLGTSDVGPGGGLSGREALSIGVVFSVIASYLRLCVELLSLELPNKELAREKLRFSECNLLQRATRSQ